LSVHKYKPISTKIPFGKPLCINLLAFFTFSLWFYFALKLAIISILGVALPNDTLGISL